MDTSTQATELITVKGRSGTLPKRQYRPIEEKRRIVEETLVEGASVARVALSHGVNANQGARLAQAVCGGATGQREPCDQAVACPRTREVAVASRTNAS